MPHGIQEACARTTEGQDPQYVSVKAKASLAERHSNPNQLGLLTEGNFPTYHVVQCFRRSGREFQAGQPILNLHTRTGLSEAPIASPTA